MHLITLALFAAAVSAGANLAGYDTTQSSSLGPSNAYCERKTYNISVTSTNTQFNIGTNPSEVDLTAALQLFVSAASNFTATYVTGTTSVTATYGISGTWCTPRSGAKPGVVQLLVHGIGWDSTYWHFGGPNIPSTFSYVQWAAASGFSTFRYDRLGTGLSDHPTDAYNVVQGATDVAILTKITSLISSGVIGPDGNEGGGHDGNPGNWNQADGHGRNPGGQGWNNNGPIKIIGVGHSYGSVQLNALTQNVPDALAGVVLTGFTANGTALPLYLTSTAYSTVSLVSPSRFPSGSLSTPYLMTLAPWTTQLNFLVSPFFTTAATTQSRVVEQPVTQGVLFTFLSLPGAAPNFKGFVSVVTGAKDWIFCYTNCFAVPPGSSASSIPALVSGVYPNAKSFQATVPANTGHDITVGTTGPSIYQGIQQYLLTVV